MISALHILPTRHRRLNLWTFDDSGVWTQLEHGRCYIDAVVWQWAKRFFWYSSKSAKGFYVRAWALENGVKRRIRMHRVVARTPADKITDHRDGNTLNNRRGNLRVCAPKQNNLNLAPRANKTGVRGVYIEQMSARAIRYVAQIFKEGKRYRKYFKCKEKAEHWRERMTHKLHGEFAYINRPVAA